MIYVVMRENRAVAYAQDRAEAKAYVDRLYGGAGTWIGCKYHVESSHAQTVTAKGTTDWKGDPLPRERTTTTMTALRWTGYHLAPLPHVRESTS